MFAGTEESSFSVTGYSFDTLQEIELPLDIANIAPEENIRLKSFLYETLTVVLRFSFTSRGIWLCPTIMELENGSCINKINKDTKPATLWSMVRRTWLLAMSTLESVGACISL